MSILDRFDFSNGELPPWLAPFISLTRPMATTMTAMMLPVGAFTVGMVAMFSADTAINMARAVEAFLHGIPDALYWLIGSIVLGYSASKTVETVGAPRPAGGVSPERTRPPAETDAAPRGKS